MQENYYAQSDGAVGDGPVDEAKAKVAGAAEEVQEKAQQTAGQLQDRIREQIDQRSSQVASQVSDQASDLRSVGESLRDQGKDGPAKAADRLADYAGKLGGYLDEKDSHALLSDAEDFGRRQPLALAAAGLALGFAASRFLKASSGRRYQGAAPARPAVRSLTATGSGSPSLQTPRVAAPVVQGSTPVV
jgi:uncharacterized protein YjbJ (UPF0337 family)